MLRAIAVLGLVCVCSAVPATPILLKGDHDVSDVFVHLHELQKIANKNGGSRAIATGYNDSAAYVKSELAKTDYLVSEQHFVVPVYTEHVPASLTLPKTSPLVTLQRCFQRTGWQHYESACDYSGVRYGGSGKYDITSTAIFVGNGCAKSAFDNFPRGKIALASAGQCEYHDKSANAEDAGASAVILFNDLGVVGVPGGRVFVSATWREGDRLVKIPTVGVTNSVAQFLRQNSDTEIRIQTDTTIELVHTYNILAETRGGDSDRIAMIGAHLDGVPEGPGINDNGSGSCTILAIAQRLNGLKFDNKLRFAWWGAEEIGLMGSRYYVRDLAENHPDQLAQIAGYLNFDMEASPNYIRLVYNGTEAGAARAGSEALQHKFEKHFQHRTLSFGLTGMGGGSDFLPFILAGVPSSGLAAGASGLKSDRERKEHGGLALTQLDPCYHAPCDSVDNVSPQCISEMLSAAIDVLGEMGNDRTEQVRVQVAPQDVLAALAAHKDTTSCISDQERDEPREL